MHRTRRLPAILLTLALAVQASGCGLILYPERKGQKKGDLDPGVVVLDAIGLLFFLIPGVVAFIVDFHHGTIYKPEKLLETSDDGGPSTSSWVRYLALGRERRADATGAR